MARITPFIEENCEIELQGQKFESGGAFIAYCTDGYMRGVVYAKPELRAVTTWHGKLIAEASFGRTYQGNFCKMRSVLFEIDGIRFTGRYCPDWAQMIRVRSTKKVEKPVDD